MNNKQPPKDEQTQNERREKETGKISEREREKNIEKMKKQL